MLVTDTSRRPRLDTTGEAWLDDVVREAVLGGVSIVQLREKHLPQGELIALGLHVRDAIAGRALLFVNGNVEAAIALAADGIHLPESATSIQDVRDRVGTRMLISRAVHSVDAAVRAERAGAGLLLAGTLFETPSKPGAPLLGAEGLSAICDAVALPLIAIGGIDASNAAAALRAGAKGVAVVSAIASAERPRDAAAALRRVIDAVDMRGVA
jgi:thiamine-phosphate pyrophosphorylase